MHGITGIMDISAAGMRFERARLEASASNIAHAHDTAADASALYRPLRVVARGGRTLEPLLLPTSAAARTVHDPGHPLADARGDVRLPDVDPLGETVTLMTAVRAYEANVRVVEAFRAMTLRALDLGGRS